VIDLAEIGEVRLARVHEAAKTRAGGLGEGDGQTVTIGADSRSMRRCAR